MSDTVGETELAVSDIIVIVLYFALVLFVGLWVRNNDVIARTINICVIVTDVAKESWKCRRLFSRRKKHELDTCKRITLQNITNDV